jgi:hypothetical protein
MSYFVQRNKGANRQRTTTPTVPRVRKIFVEDVFFSIVQIKEAVTRADGYGLYNNFVGALKFLDFREL